MRDELLNETLFRNLAHARQLIAAWVATVAILWRCALPWLALIAAILLFILGARRSGEQAGRAAERLQHTERTNDALRRMLGGRDESPP